MITHNNTDESKNGGSYLIWHIYVIDKNLFQYWFISRKTVIMARWRYLLLYGTWKVENVTICESSPDFFINYELAILWKWILRGSN